ncbi:MAG TPA: hypothetical protein VF765_09110 [Polyangiaceae bacterium]
MQRRFLLASVPLALGAVLAAGAGACGSSKAVSSGGPPDASDAASDAPEEFTSGDAAAVDVSPPPDASGYVCWIPNAGDKTQGLTDPVLLCTQDQVLGFVLQYAYVKGTGVMSSWSSTPPNYAAGTTHDWRDDLGLAAAIGDFHCSAGYYGSTVDIAKYDSTLVDLHTILPGEISKANQSYDGALYYRLRSAGLAFTYAMDSDDAMTLAAAADAWAANVMTSFTTTVTPPATGGNGDGGAADGSAPPAPVALIGQPKGNGTVQYAPAQSIMAAAALLDMARVHANDPDGGAAVPTWIATAEGTLSYVWNRARDPMSGLFYQSLITSSDPGHDALAPGGTPTSDALLTDVQGAAVLGLSRAMRALGASVIPDGGSQPPLPYAGWANQIVGAMTASNLFHGTYPPSLCTGCQPGIEPPAPPGAFMEGYVPSLSMVMPNQTVAGNAYLLGGFGFTTAIEATPVAGCQNDPNLNAVSCNFENAGIRSALDEMPPDPMASMIWPAHSSFLSVVTDQNGDVIQQAYLSAVSKVWGFAQAFSTTGGTDAGAGAGLEPGASDYSTAANLAMIEGLTELWVTRPNAPPCAY